ncbi:MAG: autotransporter-associated beta strand repeat-containing protein [Chthoniobacteraceae bacterium]
MKIPAQPRFLFAARIACVLACSSLAFGADWINTGTTDWNTGANWTGGAVPNGVNAVIQTNTGTIATISSTISATPVDIQIGIFGGNGRLDHTAGTAQTGGGNWMFIGWAGTGVYNLANTAGTGGSLTNFGTGSGSMTVNGNLQMGDPFGTGGGTATVNMNTSGTFTATGDLNVGRGGATATVNLDAGTMNGNYVNIGLEAGTIGTVNQSGGTFSSNNLIQLSGNATSTGNYNLTGGTVTAGGEIWTGAYGASTFTQSGGTVNSGQWFVLSRFNGANGTYNMSGGTVNANTVGGNVAIVSEGGTGHLNVSGGTFSTPNNILVAEGYGGSGTGTLTVSGTGSVTAGNELRLALTAGTTGTVNLNGGTLQADNVANGGAGSGTFNFNGGSLKAAQNDGNFVANLTRANVRNGGAVIDSNGFDVTIAQALLHSNIGGDNATDGGLTKNGAGTLTMSAQHTFTGAVTVNAGTLYANAGNGPTDRSFSYTSGITVNNGGTLRASVNSLFGWDGSQAKPITIHAGGTAIAESDDQNVGLVTLNGGTLASSGAIGDWGSWNFGRATDKKLLVTDDSTVSALEVGFHNGATIEVASGKNLNFTGTLTDSNDGASAVIKTSTGTLTLASANTYTAGTTVSAGTLNATNTTGSATGTGNVTIASGATLAGTGIVTTGTNNYVYVNGTLQVGNSTLGSPVASSFELNTSGTGSTVMGVGSSIYFDLFTRGGDLTASTTAADYIKLFGTLDPTLGGTLFLSNPNSLSGFANGDMWRLFDLTGGGSISDGFDLDYSSLSLDGSLTGSFDRTSGIFSISTAMVPEPSRALLLMGGIFSAILRRRRRC